MCVLDMLMLSAGAGNSSTCWAGVLLWPCFRFLLCSGVLAVGVYAAPDLPTLSAHCPCPL